VLHELTHCTFTNIESDNNREERFDADVLAKLRELLFALRDQLVAGWANEHPDPLCVPPLPPLSMRRYNCLTTKSPIPLSFATAYRWVKYAADLNHQVACFIRDLFAIVDRGFVFDLVRGLSSIDLI
jgi:hypothetical protein